MKGHQPLESLFNRFQRRPPVLAAPLGFQVRPPEDRRDAVEPRRAHPHHQHGRRHPAPPGGSARAQGDRQPGESRSILGENAMRAFSGSVRFV